MRFLKNFLLTVSVVFFLISCTTVLPINHASHIKRKTAEAPSEIFTEISSHQLITGDLLVLTVQLPSTVKSSTLRAHYGDLQLPFFPTPKRGANAFQALLGISLSTLPSEKKIELTYREGQVVKKHEIYFRVGDGNYPAEVLKVDPKHVKLKPKDLARVKREITKIRKIYQKLRTEKLWDGPFLPPIQSEITSLYGTRRVFNGELQSFHSGVDLKAAEGTEIRAPAAGVVALAQDLFLSGLTIILDHGYGVFTSYAHLSKIDVKAGQRVKSQDLLGLSGMSGRASGPHLHWGAIIHGAKINPEAITRLEF